MSIVRFILLLLMGTGLAQAENSQTNVLRVCADPNNLPYSNRAEEGFENKIAELIAVDLQRDLEYTWFPQRMGFIRNTLKFWDDEQGRFRCDLVIGVPAGFDISATTAPYYRSTYTIVIKSQGPLSHVHSPEQLAGLPSEQKSRLRVGAFAPSPVVDWIELYGFFESTVFYKVMTGDPDYYPGKIIEEELIPGHLDVVLIWGPIAGYFASQNPAAALRVIPLTSELGMRFDFAMAMGLRRGENEWKERIEKSISDNHAAIMGILMQYQVPLLAGKGSPLPVDDDD